MMKTHLLSIVVVCEFISALHSISVDLCGGNLGYIRIPDFELQDYDDVELGRVPQQECFRNCSKSLFCTSFEYKYGRCTTSSEAAGPRGKGKLRINHRSVYYEKICAFSNHHRNCTVIVDRRPQWVLLGYAELVISAVDLEDCWDSCLHAPQLYNQNCKSGLFYHEDISRNCILNNQDRKDQPQLFVEENNDIVDYFDISCAEDPVLRAEDEKITRRFSRRRRYRKRRS